MATLSVRAVASKCLRKSGSLSLKEDILNLRGSPSPQSLRSELEFIREFRCPPQAPTDLRVTEVTESTISIAWIDNADNEDGFELDWTGRRPGYYQRDDGSLKLDGSNRETYTLTELNEGYEYCISVRAFNKGGNSAYTSRVCGTIPLSEPENPPQGPSQIAIFNCHSDKRTVYFWIRDFTEVGSPWSYRGSWPAQHPDSGPCPASGATPFVIPLQEEHSYLIVAIDPDQWCGGVNDPQACQRFEYELSIFGDPDGPTYFDYVD